MSPSGGTSAPPCLALDVGGTKIEAGLVDPDGSIRSRERVSTNQAGDLFEAVVDLLARVGPGAELIGVGCGGPMHREGIAVSPLNIPAWRDFPLQRSLEDATGARVHIDNDAKALALGEGRFGAARGLSNYLSMVVSTGVGGGIVLDGRLLDGRDGNAGHIGHVVVEPEGRVCPCGARGCLEAEASGPSIQAMTGRPAAEAPVEVRRRTGEMVGRAVSSVAALLDLDRCFVAGSVALGYADDFFDSANESVHQHARIAHARGLRIEPSGLHGDGPLLGAATVAWAREGW